MNRKVAIWCLCVAAAMAAGALAVRAVLQRPAVAQDTYIYVRAGDDVRALLDSAGVRTTGWGALCRLGFRARAGRYALHEGEDVVTVFKRIRRGEQEPMMLVVPSVRQLPQLAGLLGRQLMMDSADVAPLLTDPAMIVPNTYQVYWTVSPQQFVDRMSREHDRFWNASRRAKADSLGLSPQQVATLASIVDEESAVNAEKPMIAGMYLNRLRLGMPLQADPTVKYAVGDFTLRRILYEHLAVESPYNTYLHPGLPPGPICVASVAGIDAVLNAARHNYLYMCAKEDFSGTHNFAADYSQHLRNARRYQQALNARGM